MMAPDRPARHAGRVFTCHGDADWNWLNLLSSVGGFVMTIGFGLLIIDVVVQLRYGRRVRRDMEGHDLRMGDADIAGAYVFRLDSALGPQDTHVPKGELAVSLARGEGYLGSTRDGWQETLGVHIADGEPDQLIVLPNPACLMVRPCSRRRGGTGLPVQGLLGVARAGAGHVGPVRVCRKASGPASASWPVVSRPRRSVPPHTEEAQRRRHGLALICVLVANGTLFTSLVFGTFYLWLAGGDCSDDTARALQPAAGFLRRHRLSGRRLRAGCGSRKTLLASGKTSGWMAVTAIALMVAVAMVLELIIGITPHPREHALGATASVLLGVPGRICAAPDRCSYQQLPAHPQWLSPGARPPTCA